MTDLSPALADLQYVARALTRIFTRLLPAYEIQVRRQRKARAQKGWRTQRSAKSARAKWEQEEKRIEELRRRRAASMLSTELILSGRRYPNHPPATPAQPENQ